MPPPGESPRPSAAEVADPEEVDRGRAPGDTALADRKPHHLGRRARTSSSPTWRRSTAGPGGSSGTSPSPTCTTPGSATTSCRPTATPWRSSSTACRGTRRSASRSRSTRRRPSSASTCAGTCGTPPSGTASSANTPTASSTTPPRPGPSSSAPRPRCPSSAPTGSSPPPPGRRSTTTCCNSRRTSPNWSGSCGSTRRRTSSRSGSCGSGSTAPACRGSTASSNGTTSVHGAYWRTYDFDEPPANLVDRANGNLLPDRRNVFAFPLGPGLVEKPFQHAGGEAIFDPAQRAARLLHRERRQHPARQGADRHRQRPEAAGPRGRGGRVVHVVPRHRHPPEGRPGPRPPGEEPEGVRPHRRRPDPRPVPAEGQVAEADGGGREAVRRGGGEDRGEGEPVPRRSARSRCGTRRTST